MDILQQTSEYIRASWVHAVKPFNARPDFPLPFDFVPPCIDGALVDLYYWDTFFTNLGLFADGHPDLALGNIRDLIFCLKKFGCVPNMCRQNGADYASQPPYLSLMIDYAFQKTGDLGFLKEGYDALKTEYTFWMTKRLAPNGLNRYGTNHSDDDRFARVAAGLSERLKMTFPPMTREESIAFGKRFSGEGESGEDYTERFRMRCAEISPIDLNCLLYLLERNMEKFSAILCSGEGELWKKRADERRERILHFCYDEKTGICFDYDFVNKERTGVYCAACYLPFIAGILQGGAAVRLINGKLCCEHGVVSCEDLHLTDGVRQWGYPNAWAPHNYLAFEANRAAGEKDAAESIRIKFMNTVADVFSREHKLFEKYDAVVGGKATKDEYGTPEMLGWTAGVFEYFYQFGKKAD